MTNTTQPINWFNQNMLQSPYQYAAIAAPPGGDKMDWLGATAASAPQLYNAFKGMSKGVQQFNKATSFAKSGAIGSQGLSSIKLGSKAGAAAKGAFQGIGGVAGVTGLATTALSFMPGAKADYNDGVGKAMDIGASALGAASMLGLNAIPGLGTALMAGSLINKWASKGADEHQTDVSMLGNTGSGYESLGEDISAAGKKATLLKKVFNKQYKAKNVNAQVQQLDTNRFKSADIGYKNKQNIAGSMASTADIDTKNRQKLSGGVGTGILAAKAGMKMVDLKNIKAKAKRRITKAEKGTNLIPSGQFHSRKHNISGIDVTPKGIPVISTDAEELKKGGEITQHAEIEVNEIIFHKQLTDQLENLQKQYEDGNEDAALEAGKLLAYEILENTQDNTGLLEKI